jgi:hypothetical protein
MAILFLILALILFAGGGVGLFYVNTNLSHGQTSGCAAISPGVFVPWDRRAGFPGVFQRRVRINKSSFQRPGKKITFSSLEARHAGTTFYNIEVRILFYAGSLL